MKVPDMTVAPSGWSAERCRQGHFLPDSYPATSPQWTDCACGAPQDDNKFAVRYSSVRLMTDREHAQQAIWWHVSRSPDLFVNNRDELMHWGEFDTVMHHYVTRLNSLARDGDRIMYLYSAVLKPTVDTSEHVFVENQLVDDHRELAAAYKNHGPTRYLNVRERPGSISLIARKGDFNPHQGFDLTQRDEMVIRLPE